MKAKRSGEVERSAEGGFDYDTTQQARAHSKLSSVEKRHFYDYNATQHATKRQRE
jgi:hypothetical protein